MENRFSCNGKWVTKLGAIPCENDDEWKVGTWRSESGVCKIARGRRGEATARRKRGLSREESSFESLDLRAAEVLDRSMEALESSTSLTSCASGMPMEYPHWKGGAWELQDITHEVVGRRQNWDPSQHLHLSQRGGLITTTPTAKLKDFHGGEHDIARVLKEMVNNNVNYDLKMSTTMAKTVEDTIDRMLVKDLNVKENTFQEHQLSYYAKGRLQTSPLGEKPLGGGQKPPSPPPSPVSQDDIFMKGGEGYSGRVSIEKMRDTTSCDTGSDIVATLDRLTQTDSIGLSSYQMLPPKGKRYRDSRVPTRPTGEQLQIDMKINSTASQRRRKRSLVNNHSKQRKLIFPSKPPKWKGLSTALSAMRSMCHGAGELGVVHAHARPLLIIAGKCVFRTTPPLDTPRLCTISHQPKWPLHKASNANEEHFCALRSSDTKATSYHNQAASKSMLPNLTSLDGHLNHNKFQPTSSSIKHWPVVVTELDNWISQVVNDWLEKDEKLAVAANSSLNNSSMIIGNSNISNAIGPDTRENFGVLCVSLVSNIMEVPNPQTKSVPKTHEELGRPMSAPTKKPSELDAKIGQAQTVHDLSQLLEPISQTSMLSALDTKVAGDIKISASSIIQEFMEDDIVQEFQRQIQSLEQENK
ncbi:unnamed protein product [Calypogeia fissa]